MKNNTFKPNIKFNFSNNEKPQMSLGDLPVESLSNNDSLDDKNNNIINENDFEIPKENKIINISNDSSDEIKKENRMPSINFSFNDKSKEIKNIKKDFQGINNFSMMKRSTWSKENDRYNSNISEIYDNNLRFLSFCDNDYNEEDDDIVNIANSSEINSESNNNENNNDLSNQYIKGFNADFKLKTDNQVEIVLKPNIWEIFSSEDYKIESSSNSNESKKNINKEIKKNLLSSNSIINEVEKNTENNLSNIINNKEENSYLIKGKYNDIINNIEENNNNLIEDNNYNIINSKNNKNKLIEGKDNNIINIEKNKDKIQNNKIADLRNSKNFFKMNRSLNKKRLISKQKRIFQKFLCVSIDTSGLYSLDNEMKILLLNPKITYNYPYNKMERELE